MADDRSKTELRSVDALIVGAGLGGSAIATLLARAGWSTVLVEKDQFPRDKLCGEFLSPESAGFLARLGVSSALERLRPASIHRSRFTSVGGAELEIRLPGIGIGISRWALDAMLAEQAAEAGAEVVCGEVVGLDATGPRTRVEVVTSSRGQGERLYFEAGLVVGAHGRRSKLDRALGREFMRAPEPYSGFKRHHRARSESAARSLEGSVEIHAVDGGYCGMSFVEDDKVNVCMLLEQRFLDRLANAKWPTIVERLGMENHVLAARLETLEPCDDRVLAVSSVPFGRKDRYTRGVFFIGDAAGLIAPLAGDGQAMALSNAFALFDLIEGARGIESIAELDRLGRAWDGIWRRRYALRVRLGRHLQRWLLQPRAADRALRAIGSIPGLAPTLARLTREPLR